MRTVTFSAFAAVVLMSVSTQASAQVYTQTVYYAAQPTTFVHPAPVVSVPTVNYVQPTTVYRPVLRPMTTVTYPAAQPLVQTSYYSPQPVYAPQPVVVARPVVTAPVQVVTPQVVTAAPVISTRYRPILGGTVTRSWYP